MLLGISYFLCVVGGRVETVDNETNEKPPYELVCLPRIRASTLLHESYPRASQGTCAHGVRHKAQKNHPRVHGVRPELQKFTPVAHGSWGAPWPGIEIEAQVSVSTLSTCHCAEFINSRPREGTWRHMHSADGTSPHMKPAVPPTLMI